MPAEDVADGIIAALGGDRFEHYLPDMKAVVDAKNADIDAYIAGAAAMAPSMKALVFGVRPEPLDGPDDALTHSPVALQPCTGSCSAAR